MDTKKQLLTLENLAKSMIKQGKQITPMVVLFTPSEVIPIRTAWRDRQEKYNMIHSVAKLAKQKQAIACSFISEMWFATPNKSEKSPEDTPVAERSDRREGVLISVKEASGKEITKYFEVEYKEGVKRLKEVGMLKSGDKNVSTQNYLLEELHKAIDWNVN